MQARALRVFGVQAQLLQLAEELSEAAAAVARLANGKGDSWDAIEELVDVESVVASLRDHLGTPETWAGIRSVKEDKLREVLERADRERARA